MALREQLNEDIKTAMKAREADKLAALRLLSAAVKQREVDERIVVDDPTVISIIDKLVKQRKDSIAQFTAGNRQDLVDKESAELAVLETYLPKRLDADQVAHEVAQVIAALNASGPGDMGKVMGAVKARLDGKADMALVSTTVKQALAR